MRRQRPSGPWRERHRMHQPRSQVQLLAARRGHRLHQPGPRLKMLTALEGHRLHGPSQQARHHPCTQTHNTHCCWCCIPQSEIVRSHFGPNLLKYSALSNLCWILSEMIDLEPRWVDVSLLLTVGPSARLTRYEPVLLLDGIQFERLIDNLLFRLP